MKQLLQLFVTESMLCFKDNTDDYKSYARELSGHLSQDLFDSQFDPESEGIYEYSQQEYPHLFTGDSTPRAFQKDLDRLFSVDIVDPLEQYRLQS